MSPSSHAERERVLHQLQEEFQEEAGSPNLFDTLLKRCMHGLGFSRRVAKEYAEIVYDRIQYNVGKDSEKKKSGEVP